MTLNPLFLISCLAFSRRTKLNSTHGYTLIEILVALVITAVGVLGLLQTQINSAKAEHDLLLRLQANLLAADMARKLDVIGNHAPMTVNLSQPPASAIDCRAVTCSRSQLATFYIAHWKCRLGKWTNSSLCSQFKLSGTLTDGDGRVSSHSGNKEITVQWLDSRQQTQSLTYYHAQLPG